MAKEPKYKKLTPESIKVEKTEDKPKSQYYKRTGKVYGLGVIQFQSHLFEINEQLPTLKKMTDAEIQRQILVEFGHYPDTKRYYSKTRRAIVEARQRYNRGRMVPSVDKGPPDHLSFRYNSRGEKIHRNRVMTPDQVERYLAHWTAYHMMLAEEAGLELKRKPWMVPVTHKYLQEELAKTREISVRSKAAWEEKSSRHNKRMDEEED